MPETKTEPSYDCKKCPRLRDFILDNRKKYPEFFNGPVPSFGSKDARLLIVGLAALCSASEQTCRSRNQYMPNLSQGSNCGA